MSVCIDLKPVPAEQFRNGTLSCKPCPLSLSQTTQVELFPKPDQLQKLGQFEPVLALGNFIKNLKFQTFCINFTTSKLNF